MGVQDFVVKKRKVSRSGRFDRKGLIKELDRQLDNQGYKYLELGIKEKRNSDGTVTLTKSWACERRLSPTEKLVINIEFSSTTKKVSYEKDGKKKTMDEGDVEIAFVGLFKKDTEDEWSLKKEKVPMRVLREAYDKYLRGKKTKFYVDEVKKDIDAIIYGLKRYLKMSMD